MAARVGIFAISRRQDRMRSAGFLHTTSKYVRDLAAEGTFQTCVAGHINIQHLQDERRHWLAALNAYRATFWKADSGCNVRVAEKLYYTSCRDAAQYQQYDGQLWALSDVFCLGVLQTESRGYSSWVDSSWMHEHAADLSAHQGQQQVSMQLVLAMKSSKC